MRFFFDYVTRSQSLYDYQGDEFRSAQAAIAFAGFIAEDLKHRLSGEWNDWRLEVRSAEGATLLSLPVESANATWQSQPRRGGEFRPGHRLRLVDG